MNMNETIRELFDRKSVRVFEDRPISPEDKALILEAACMAPTAGNRQLYTIIDVTDQAIKERLVDTCDHQPFIAKAKMVLIFCADCRKWYEGFKATGCAPRKPGVGDLMIAVSDANIAAQNAVTAAKSLGIGSCYIGDIMENAEQQQELLHLPEYVFPAAMLVFGYPTRQQQERKKPARVAMEHIVQENGYRCMDEKEMQAMWEPLAGEKDYESWMKAFCTRKYNADFSRERNRSVAAYLAHFEE